MLQLHKGYQLQCLVLMVQLKKNTWNRSFSNSVPHTTAKFYNEEINDMVKIIKALEDSDVFMKGVSKTLKNDAQRGTLLLIPMLLGTLGISLLSGKGLFRAGSGHKCSCDQGMYRACQNQGQGLFRAGQGFKKNH